MSRSSLFLTFMIALTVPRIAEAQQLRHTDLIPGQSARFEFAGLMPHSSVVFEFSTGAPHGHAHGLSGGTPGTASRRQARRFHRQADRAGTARLSLQLPASLRSGVLRMGAVGTGVSGSTARSVMAVGILAPGPLPPYLDDDFDGSSLDPSWSLLNPSLVNLTVSGGELHLEAAASGGAASWFADGEGPFVYKEIQGDFVVTATARAYATTQPTQVPPAPFRLGGVLARDPASVSGSRNSVHVVLGAGSVTVPVAAEDKSTDESISTFCFHGITEARGQLRLVRQADLFSMYYRALGGASWQLLASHPRTDLPSHLQIGLMVYSFSIPEDITVSFDEIRFR